MKRILSLLLLILLPLVASAQAKSEHLSFMGIPLDGKVAPFIEKLKAKGLTYVGNVDNGVDALEGSFLGHSDCRILVHSMPKTGLVYAVSVLMKKQNSWEAVEAQYKSVKHALREQYGEPSSSAERFTDGDVGSDVEKMEAAAKGKSYYFTSYKLAQGVITLRVHAKEQSAFCVLIYADTINAEIMEQVLGDGL